MHHFNIKALNQMNSAQPTATVRLTGLHHVTAVASDPRRNVDFYTRVLGLRLIKRTVNFDDPSTYHLYYGDSVGTPGSVLTFFPWAGLRRGRPGNGQAYATAFSVPAGSLPFWTARLIAHGITPAAPITRFGDEVLVLTDHDGLVLELVATAEADARTAHTHPEIAAAQGKFWPMYDKLYSQQDNLEPGYYGEYAAQIGMDKAGFQKAFDAGSGEGKVTAATAFSDGLGVQQTPTTLLHDSVKHTVTIYVGLDGTKNADGTLQYPGINALAIKPPWGGGAAAAPASPR